MAVTAPSAKAVVIIPTYTSNVTNLPNALQIETAVSYAIQQFQGMYANNMTIYMTVDTGSSGIALGNSFSTGQGSNYTAIRNALVANAFTNTQISNVNYNWPANDPTGNNSTWILTTSQAKAIGLHSANDPVSDGTFTFNASTNFNYDPFDRGISGQTDFIGTAEHEISEIMGRNNYGFGTLVNGKSQYAPFNLTRYTASGVRNFVPSQGGVYFSPDGGTSNLSPFNNQSGGDATDWLTTSPYTADSFNAFSNSGITNNLSPADETVMETLGYIPQPTTLGWGNGSGDFLASSHWSTTSQGAINPHHGASLIQNSLNSVAYHFFTSGESFVLSDHSDMGQTLQITTGLFDVDASGPANTNGFGLLVNQNGHLTVNSTGVLQVAGPLSIGNDTAANNSLANITDFASVTIGTVFGTNATLYVGNAGVGTFNQAGSSSVSTGDLIVGGTATGSGLYFLGGTATLTVIGNEFVGYSGGGVLNQSSGNHTIAGRLDVGTIFSGSLGRFEIDGGNLTVGTLNVLSTSSSGFIQTGGTVTVTGTLSIESENVHSANFSITSGLLNASNVIIDSNGNFTLSSGSVDITNNLSVGVGSYGNFNYSAGVLSAGSITIGSLGSFTMSSGFLNSTVTNYGNFTYSGGSFFAHLINAGNTVLNANFAPSFGMENDVPFVISPLRTLTFNGIGALDNESDITLSGTITGTGTKTNNGSIEFNGIISGSGQFINAGTFTQTFGGTFTLAGTPYVNAATGIINLDVSLGHFFFINTPNAPSSDRLINYGTINFVNGSVLSGSGGVENGPGGIINASQSGSIQTAYFLNNAGATILIPAGTFKIAPAFSNLGNISLTDANSNLIGGVIANNGIIYGFGTLASAGVGVSNGGILEASGGTLIVPGVVSDLGSGVLQPDTGATLLLTGSFGTNNGIIHLNGGTFDTNNQPITNHGQITGYGTLNTSSLLNGFVLGLIREGFISLSGGDSFINTNINNVTSISVTTGSATFSGNITGNGTFSSDTAVTSVAGTFTTAQFTATASTNIFQNNVVIPSNGSMNGDANTQFTLNGGTFTNNGSYNNSGALVSVAPIINNGDFTQSGTMIESADFTNTGTATISGPQFWNAGSTFTNSGTASITTDAGSDSSAPLNIVNNAGLLQLATPQHLSSLTIADGNVTLLPTDNPRGDTGVALKTSSLSIAPTSSIDISNHDFIIGNTDIATIQVEILNGFGIGPGGAAITSSTAFADGNKFLIPIDADANGITSWDNVDITDPATIVVKYTYFGDANLDGLVDGNDFSVIAGNFGDATPGVSDVQTSWLMGDMNLDGVVDGNDFSVVAGNFGDDLLITPATQGVSSTNVPEPATLLLFGLGAVLVKSKKDHKNHKSPGGRTDPWRRTQS